MVRFITDRIEEQANISLDLGIEKYKKYFVYTTIYARYRTQVNELLENEGYADCIVV